MRFQGSKGIKNNEGNTYISLKKAPSILEKDLTLPEYKYSVNILYLHIIFFIQKCPFGVMRPEPWSSVCLASISGELRESPDVTCLRFSPPYNE